MRIRGTSVYCGIDVSIEEIKAHLKEAHEAGINAVFTSLQLPEADPETLLRDFPIMSAEAHKYGMLVSADIHPNTAKKFGIDTHDIKAFKDLGVDIMRIDWGYTHEEIAAASYNEYGMMLMLSPDVTEQELKELCELDVNKERILFCHNYYPMRYTGMLPDRAKRINKLIHNYGFRVSGFLASNHHHRLACSIGLPTIEGLREVDTHYAIQAMLLYGFDDLFFGDDLASKDEMSALAAADAPVTFRMKMLIEDKNLEEWLDNRPLPNYQCNLLPEIIRTKPFGGLGVYKYDGDTEVGFQGPRKKGNVMLVKKSLYRYCGEVQIARKELPDEDGIGIVGQIAEDDLPLLDDFPSAQFRFKIVK